MTDSSPLLRPIARRPFDLSSASTESSSPPTPNPETGESSLMDPRLQKDTLITKTHSILNLTSSTLFGIYSPTGYEPSRDEATTPWGTGAQTPVPQPNGSNSKPSMLGAHQLLPSQISRNSQLQHHHSPRNSFRPLALRTLLLFVFGVAYGVIITHLHDNHGLAPVKIEGINRHSWHYLLFWGIAGVGLGGLLPWVDILWEETLGDDESARVSKALKALNEDLRSVATGTSKDEDERPTLGAESGLGAHWIPIVRSIGAFVGIAFAIRKLPWQSTLQVSLTLALVNPVLWYLLDRSKAGFLLSTIVGITGTAVLLGVNPEMIPMPASPLPRASFDNTSYDGLMHDAMVSNESIGAGTWIASVLFCSSLCFGNIGRRLALGSPGRRSSVS